MIKHLVNWYLTFVEKTSRVEIDSRPLLESGRSVLGFWPGDSCTMNLLLHKVCELGRTVEVVVTADRRGDIIEQLIRRRGGTVIRLKDGMGIHSGMRELKADAKSAVDLFGCALDGPLGPEHQAKKLAFYLAEVICRYVDDSRCISLPWR